MSISHYITCMFCIVKYYTVLLHMIVISNFIQQNTNFPYIITKLEILFQHTHMLDINSPLY